MVEHPDVVISDWHMPRMSGIGLLKRLRDEGIQATWGGIVLAVVPALVRGR